MHQLMTLDPTVVAYDRTDAADAGVPGGIALPRCLPPVPSMTMKASTLGIHATVSYLVIGAQYEGSLGALRISHALTHQWMTL